MTTRTRKHWTQEDIQKLIALTEEGASNADIANQLDCTAHSCLLYTSDAADE